MKISRIIGLGLILMAGSAFGTVTLQFTLPTGTASGFASTAGLKTGGLTWGIVVDTTGNGFSTTYGAGFTLSNNSILGGTGDDVVFIAQALTGAVSPFNAAENGTISSIAGVAFGAAAGGTTIDAGDRFAIIWFNTGVIAGSTIANGTNYGLLQDPGFVIPADGATQPYNTLAVFAGVDPTRPANLTFGVVPEPSVALLGAVGALGLLRRRRN